MPRTTEWTLAGFALVALSSSVQAQWEPSRKLEIHYINVGQGASTLLIGPNGTRILYDFGKVSGDRDIVPYLRDSVGLAPQQGIHFAFVSHRDTDHYVGYREVVGAGYDVLVANYGPGSPKVSPKITKHWLRPAETTTAGAVRSVPVGLPLALGDGAQAIVVAANGWIYGDPRRAEIQDENDRSIALYVTYKNFQYILDGDLGGGPERCSRHDTQQINVQTRVARSLLNLGLMSPAHGVDVLHVAHHGSESSTPASYYNLMRPEVALISVGLAQGRFRHPRFDVVDGVLLQESNCRFTAPRILEVLQTEDGKAGKSSTGKTSFSGKTIGNIKLVTDGQTEYQITGDNVVHGGQVENPAKPYSRRFDLDEVSVASDVSSGSQ